MLCKSSWSGIRGLSVAVVFPHTNVYRTAVFSPNVLRQLHQELREAPGVSQEGGGGGASAPLPFHIMSQTQQLQCQTTVVDLKCSGECIS